MHHQRFKNCCFGTLNANLCTAQTAAAGRCMTPAASGQRICFAECCRSAAAQPQRIYPGMSQHWPLTCAFWGVAHPIYRLCTVTVTTHKQARGGSQQTGVVVEEHCQERDQHALLQRLNAYVPMSLLRCAFWRICFSLLCSCLLDAVFQQPVCRCSMLS